MILRLGVLLLLLAPVAMATAPVPLYKPSSRAPEPLDITQNVYGYSATAPDALRIGDRAPDFDVAGLNGIRVRLAELRDSGPVVIIFYRGHW